ncbi:MAG: uracil-DNA glycosylase [Armatimonadota bacterium]
MEDTQKRVEILNEIATQVANCTRCPLHKQRNLPVFGEGPPDADIMFIGEGPGAQEDKTGRPFVGNAGKLLTRLLQEAGLQRQDVFITNIIKCRPPDNRDPKTEEREACAEYLDAQIAVIRPRAICLLGRPALQALLEPTGSIGKMHGTPVRRHGILWVPLYHPAAALHNPELEPQLVEDMVKLQEILQENLG